MIKTGCTDTIKTRNEDSYGTTKSAAFVMDGASALIEPADPHLQHPVHHFVTWWIDYLTQTLDDKSRSIDAIIEAGIHAYRAAFPESQKHTPLEAVSSTLAIVRQEQDVLHAYVLGDAEVIMAKKNGEIVSVTDPAIQKNDAEVVSLMAQNPNRENEIIYKGFTAEELRLLRKNRLTMNTESGYPILSDDPSAAYRAQEIQVPLASLEDVLLLTDGLYPLYSELTKETLITMARTDGPDVLIKAVRHLELNDQKKETVKRLKTHDDATAVYVSKCSALSGQEE
ncbi:protein phosphatase 2C domain-containing protein [Salisediminibacterium selenitireducens]|uniref:PPM-type phosphatase domain-containing protein n=1 Tax=Bacillus selenitireducens (strain ATCC 700615 / DSM 15326 / MLS10) TaxID=439292 RepID=D6XXU9_BACIE|nr:protein phosphatase 2C domain-containing protein [Salisediminibacterium selenitireducens]ADI00142.1 hypothetical protein Bsel_2642 [[Bacillus] selenitireducens MLS10]